MLQILALFILVVAIVYADDIRRIVRRTFKRLRR